jgi:hypothetical protein
VLHKAQKKLNRKKAGKISLVDAQGKEFCND